ncbi:hypothetical protein ACKVMT_01550 [Halobacteriales archaeon Cl-PHB]
MTGSDRGVTDVVAFVLMFSVIILSIGLVSTAGLDALEEMRDDEQLNSAERGMQTVASTLADVHRQGDSFRRVRLAPNHGHVRLAESTLRVTAGGTIIERDVNALEHELQTDDGSVALVYESGAVFRTDGGSARFRPDWRCSPDTGLAVVSLVNLTTDGSLSVGGGQSSQLIPDPEGIPSDAPVRSAGQSVEVNVVRTSATVAYRGDGPVTIDVGDTVAPDQWGFYLEDETGWSQVGTDRFECSGVDTVLVRVTTVEVSL